MNALPFHICLAGPTASGKTAAALAIAERHPCEIISVDSALVFRSMDIGTAKPSAAELAAVPHHLINIRDPLNAYSAAEFVRDAQALITDIAARGKLPLLVGGTMLYFKALFDGLDDMPAANPEVRTALDAEAAAKGWPAMHAELALVDPITAARLAPGDSQRIQRALEVYRISGLPLSHFHAASAAIKTEAARADSTRARALISLEPADRAWLHSRIAQRFDDHAGAGLYGRGAGPARARRSAPGPAQRALRGLPPGLGSLGWPVAPGRVARQGHLRHTPARQAANHLAALHAAAAGGGR